MSSDSESAGSQSAYDSTNDDSSVDDACNNRSQDDSSKDHKDSKTLYIVSYVSIGSFATFVSILLICNLYPLPICCNVFQNNHNDRSTQDQYENRKEIIQDFRKSVENNKLKFKNQNDNIWHVFASQIEEVINESTKTSVIILLGNETNTVTCLAHLFGHISSKALNNDNYLTLNARNIGNDQGKIIKKLKAEIQIDRVVIIEDLLNINPEAIKSLHNLCDKEHPLVSKTVYIITIISSDYEGSNEDTFVEDCLTAKFSKTINLDILNPLITRIMDGPIISVLPELSMKKSKTVAECLLF